MFRSHATPASSEAGSGAASVPEAAVQPDLVLECSEAFFEPAITAPSPGRSPTAHTIKAHSALLILASPYFRRVLAGSTPEMPVSSVQVEGSRRAWGLILSRLMPVYPHPELSVDAAWLILPLAAKYEMRAVTAEVMTFLGDQLPLMLDAEPTSNTYVIKWLSLAEELHLEALRTLCLAKVRDMAAHGQLRHALLHDPLTRKVPPSTASEEPHLLAEVKALDSNALEDLLISMVLASMEEPEEEGRTQVVARAGEAMGPSTPQPVVARG